MGRRGGNRMLVGFITTYAISKYHQPNYVFESGSGEVYFIQHYKFDSGLRHVGVFFLALRFPLPIKLTATR
jgi:hypothetical protein